MRLDTAGSMSGHLCDSCCSTCVTSVAASSLVTHLSKQLCRDFLLRHLCTLPAGCFLNFGDLITFWRALVEAALAFGFALA